MSVKIQAKAELARRATNRAAKRTGGVKIPCATPELLPLSAKDLRSLAGIAEKAPKAARKVTRKPAAARKVNPRKGMSRLAEDQQRVAKVIYAETRNGGKHKGKTYRAAMSAAGIPTGAELADLPFAHKAIA
jgi:hypothetical protein